LKKKEYFVESGTVYEHQKAKDYFTATQEFKELLNRNKNDSIQTFLQSLTPIEFTNYSLWKEMKKLK
jgi:hypothetical protein